MLSKFSSLIFIVILFSFLIFPSQDYAYPPSSMRSPAEVIEKVNHNFQKIRDAAADITLDYAFIIFGCSGPSRLQGKGYFKTPDKILGILENRIIYYVRGNNIRKIDERGKRFYVTLLYAPDCSIGFHPGLIPHNFFLTTIKDTPDEIVIMGFPKPGVLRNVTKIFFYIDPKEFLLRKLDVKFANENLLGLIEIDYQKIEDLWIPVGCHGSSAMASKKNILMGIKFKVRGQNIKINQGLPDKLFEPGF